MIANPQIRIRKPNITKDVRTISGNFAPTGEHGLPNSCLLSMIDAANSRPMSLSPNINSMLEERFGTKMSGLKVFRDSGLESIGRGYARGNEIHLSDSEDINTKDGKQLLMHEASHVIQQGSGMTTGGGILQDSALESQADMGLTAPANFSMPASAEAAPIQGWFWNKRKDKKAQPNRYAAAPVFAGKWSGTGREENWELNKVNSWSIDPDDDPGQYPIGATSSMLSPGATGLARSALRTPGEDQSENTAYMNSGSIRDNAIIKNGGVGGDTDSLRLGWHSLAFFDKNEKGNFTNLRTQDALRYQENRPAGMEAIRFDENDPFSTGQFEGDDADALASLAADAGPSAEEPGPSGADSLATRAAKSQAAKAARSKEFTQAVTMGVQSCTVVMISCGNKNCMIHLDASQQKGTAGENIIRSIHRYFMSQCANETDSPIHITCSRIGETEQKATDPVTGMPIVDPETRETRRVMDSTEKDFCDNLVATLKSIPIPGKNGRPLGVTSQILDRKDPESREQGGSCHAEIGMTNAGTIFGDKSYLGEDSHIRSKTFHFQNDHDGDDIAARYDNLTVGEEDKVSVGKKIIKLHDKEEDAAWKK